MKAASILWIITQYRRLLTRRGRALLLVVILLGLVSGVVEGLALFVVMVGAATLATGQPALGVSLWGWVGVLAALALLGFVFSYAMAQVSYRAAFDLMRTCHHVIGDALAKLPLGWFGMTQAGRYSRAVTSGMMSMGQNIAHTMSLVTTNCAAVLTLLVGLLLWQPLLGGLLAAAIPLYAVVVWGAGRLSYLLSRAATPAKNELSERIVEFAANQAALRSCGRAGDPPHLAAAVRAESKASLRQLWGESGILMVSGMISQLIVVALMVGAGNLALDGQLSAIDTIAFLGVGLRLVTNLSSISDGMVGLQSQTPILEAIAEVLDTPTLPEPSSAQTPRDASVTLEEVSFGYHNDRSVLDRVSLSLRPNTLTALVGPSGSGKTTIARLISRFYDVDAGVVRVGGVDVREIASEDLMASLSMVFQDVYLYDDTLAANIRVGREDATEEEIREVADLAGVTEIVRRLPDGWDSRVGEGGCRLSGGERQRVSIARALLKGAPIVLVDEATSALDAENEANVQRALERLRQSATLLVIAHKLSTIRNADQIIVLGDDGSVAQVGTHETLVNQPGRYRDYWLQRERAAGWNLVATETGE